MAWDTRPVHRLERFPGYKASRKPTPSLLKQQQPYLRPLVEAFGYRNVELEGYEADDVIGTLSLRARRAGHRDLRDLARSRRLPARLRARLRAALAARRDRRARLHARARRGPLRHPAAARARLHRPQGRHLRRHPGRARHRRQDGLRPARALRLARGHLRERRRRARREAAPDADRAPRGRRALEAAGDDRARPRRSTSTSPRRCADPPDRATMGELFRRFEFRALLRRIDELEAAVPGAVIEREEHAVGAERGDAAALAALLARRRPDRPRRRRRRPARRRARRAGAADRGERGHGRARGRREPARRAQLQAVRRRARRGRRRAGLRHRAGRLPDRPGPQRVRPRRPARRAGPRRRGRRRRGRRGARAPRRGQRCCCTSRWPRASPSASSARCWSDIELPLVPVLCAMERAGVAIDSARMGEIAARVSEQVEALEEQAHELAGEPFALGSPKQLGEVLFERLELPAGQARQDGLLDRLRRCSRASATCTRSCRSSRSGASSRSCSRPTCCRSPSCSATTAACTRRSRRSRRPPAGSRRSARTCRTSRSARRSGASCARRSWPRPGTACSRSTTRRSSCASSRTSRARSCCARRSRAATTSTPSRPPRCSARTRDDLSKDERNRAKAVNFGIIYGISAHGLSEQLEISRDEAQAYIDTYRGRMPLVAEFIERAIARRARARLRRHAARPPPADPRAARAELERALAGRAPGRQHRDPGQRRRHHQARDGAHPPPPAPRRAAPRASCCRSTTSCCSRCPTSRRRAVRELVRRGDGRRLPARPAARGRQRRRRRLARRQDAERTHALPIQPDARAGDRVARYNPQFESGVAPCAAAWNLRKPPTDMPQTNAEIMAAEPGVWVEVDGKLVPDYDAKIVSFDEGDVLTGTGRACRSRRDPRRRGVQVGRRHPALRAVDPPQHRPVRGGRARRRGRRARPHQGGQRGSSDPLQEARPLREGVARASRRQPRAARPSRAS